MVWVCVFPVCVVAQTLTNAPVQPRPARSAPARISTATPASAGEPPPPARRTSHSGSDGATPRRWVRGKAVRPCGNVQIGRTVTAPCRWIKRRRRRRTRSGRTRRRKTLLRKKECRKKDRRRPQPAPTTDPDKRAGTHPHHSSFRNAFWKTVFTRNRNQATEQWQRTKPTRLRVKSCGEHHRICGCSPQRLERVCEFRLCLTFFFCSKHVNLLKRKQISKNFQT